MTGKRRLPTAALPIGRRYTFRSQGITIGAWSQVALSLRLPRKVLKAARAARAEGRRMLVTAELGVRDPAGNEGQTTVRVRPR